jgi:hypothetical protein
VVGGTGIIAAAGKVSDVRDAAILLYNGKQARKLLLEDQRHAGLHGA